MDSSRKTVTLDWLSYTIHWNTELAHTLGTHPRIESIANAASFQPGDWIQTSPRNGYLHSVSKADCPGLCVMASEPNSPMGIHISYSGTALSGLNPRALLRQVINAGGSVRRIDLAFDVMETPYWDGLVQMLEQKQVDTRAKQWQHIKSSTGHTVYVGSRTSEKFLRIYDKAAESGQPGPWTRIELECKSDYAVGIAKYIDENGYEGIPEIIRAFAAWPQLRQFDRWFDSPTLFDGLPKQEKATDTRRWLMENVAPALARELKSDQDFYVRFLGKVMVLAGVGEAAGEVDIFDGKADFDPT